MQRKGTEVEEITQEAEREENHRKSERKGAPSTRNKEGGNQGNSRKVPRIRERDVPTEQAQEVPAWGRKRPRELPHAADTDPPNCAKKHTTAQHG